MLNGNKRLITIRLTIRFAANKMPGANQLCSLRDDRTPAACPWGAEKRVTDRSADRAVTRLTVIAKCYQSLLVMS